MMRLAAIVLIFSAVAQARPGHAGRTNNPGNPLPVPLPQPVASGNIPTMLTSNGLTTLVDLVTKAGLAETLSGPGPFTVFAPTNDAFGAVDAATLKSLEADLNKLKNVLTFHVVPTGLLPPAIKSGLTPPTVSGPTLNLKVDGETVTINGALRLKTIEASNGIIYVIDKVLIPGPEKDIVQTLENKGQFTTLLTALKVAGLTETLKTPGSLTLLAPTDTAFKALPAGALDGLIAEPEKLKKVLLNHVVKGTVMSRELPGVPNVSALGGDSYPVVVAAGGVTIGKAKVVESDLSASNGVIHIIDTVLV